MGSTPLAEAVTKSIGISAVLPGSKECHQSMRSSTSFFCSSLVGDRFVTPAGLPIRYSGLVNSCAISSEPYSFFVPSLRVTVMMLPFA